MSLYIGLMSGTSLDAIDAVVVEISGQNFKLKHAINHSIPDDLKKDLQTLMHGNGVDEVELLGTTDARFGDLLAQATNQVLKTANIAASDITAIGSHGQTIRHRPDQQHAFTLQIGDPSRIAEMTGITTVADFRRRDIAAGGQGAPLVPAFHRALFATASEDRCAINIGGMANISFIPADVTLPTGGYDTGPGNVLMDYWCQQHTGQQFDKNGDWARTGNLDESLLQELLKDPYFSQPAPKSTGREKFNADWITEKPGIENRAAEDIQRCLLELTAQTIIDAIENSFPSSKTLILCGGGSHNTFLQERLQHLAPERSVNSSLAFGIEPDWVEAAAFAWLADCTMNKIPANVPAVTGARAPVVLGAIYPA